MIKFNNLSRETPYIIFKELYDKAIDKDQKNIEAMSISSYSHEKKEVDSRFVNLKLIDNYNFIFFTNYDSPKAIAFESHNQVSALFFWSSINTQIRIKARITKTSNQYNNSYFKQRSLNKNALAISSHQSRKIDSFNSVKESFIRSLTNDDLKKCPEYWGGFSLTPYEIEFWKGGEFRLNKRNLYKKDNNKWNHYILEP